MNKRLETARREYNLFFESEVFPVLGLDEADLDDLGFDKIATRIKDSAIRKQYRRLAIDLLEENIRDHQIDRPRALDLFDAGSLLELRDWQDVTIAWEHALWAIVSQKDA